MTITESISTPGTNQATEAAAAITVRPAASPEEVTRLFRAASITFSPSQPPEKGDGWRDEFTSSPEFDPTHLVCAFRGDSYLGGCVLYERSLRVGPSTVKTVCIGGVHVLPEYRHQGIASVFVRYVTDYAIARDAGLLLLDGIPDFYHQFGYTSVIDIDHHSMKIADVLKLPASEYQVREATIDDLSALIALYERHFAGYAGAFVHTPLVQGYSLSHRELGHRPWLAVDQDGEPCGYLQFSWELFGERASEVTADDWPAVLALAQHHAGRVRAKLDGDIAPGAPAPEPAKEITWPLPLDSYAFHALRDRLSLHSHTTRELRGFWMARPARLACLLQSLVPYWSAAWKTCGTDWCGTLGLTIDGERHALVLSADGAALAEAGTNPDLGVELSAEVFTKLLFGHRTVAWAERQAGQAISPAAQPVLVALCEGIRGWVPGGDAF